LLRCLLLALVLTGAPAALAETARPMPATVKAAEAHADWSRLLTQYVQVGADGVNRFDYGALKASKTDRAALDAYIARFAKADLSGTSEAEFATWANLYNAVTVRYIIERYPVKSIRDGYIVGPWKEIKVMAGGETVSLDQIEHTILRPRFKDPRVHYAINCASYSCPNLLPKALEASTLNADLDLAARAYVNHSRGVKVSGGRLVMSSIYDWFKEDFGGREGVKTHLLKYAAPKLAADIKAATKPAKFAYDWSLNDVGEPKKAKK
jgi:Protein of unknown function, DUF547